MEPDDDLRIREKLKEWEDAPYPLDKDRLWREHMTLPRSRSGLHIAYYYAAASLVLAAALVYYTVSERERSTAELRIKELELTLLNARALNVQSDKLPAAVPCP